MNTQKGGLWLKNIYKDSLPNNPLVTVVMPVFNNEDTLGCAIESVLSQTYNNIEFIIIDGGSTDKTLEVIRKYEDRIDYWQSEPDKGIADAMNRGVKAAHGDWIHILNSDDYYASSDCIARVVKAMGGPKDTFYYFTLHFLEKSGKIRQQKYPFKWLNRWKLYYSAYIAHPTLFVSKQQYQAVNYYDDTYKICGDHDLILKLCKVFKGCFVDIPVTIMRAGGVSEMNMAKTFGEFKIATIKAGLPSWLAEIIFKFKLWKHNLRKKNRT